MRLLTAGIFALAGLLFWTSFNTAQGTNLRTDDSLLELSDLIQERSRENARLDDRSAAVRAEIDRLARRDDGSTDAQDRKLDALEKAAAPRRSAAPA